MLQVPMVATAASKATLMDAEIGGFDKMYGDACAMEACKICRIASAILVACKGSLSGGSAASMPPIWVKNSRKR